MRPQEHRVFDADKEGDEAPKEVTNCSDGWYKRSSTPYRRELRIELMDEPDFDRPLSFPVVPGRDDERITHILESITDGFTAFDENWNFTFVNAAACRILAPHLGGDARSLVGKNYWEAFPLARGTIIEREYRRAVKDQVAVEFEVFYEPWARWFAVRGYPISEGGLSAYFRDITEEKRNNTILQENAEKYRALVNSMEEALCVIEMVHDSSGRAADYRFIESNPAFERQAGVAPSIGRTVLEVYPSHEPYWIDLFAEVARTGRRIHFDREATSLNKWFTGYAFRLGEHEEAARVAILFTDVSERRLVETQATQLAAEGRARVAELETLLAVLPIGIGIALDRECREIRTNPALAEVLGVPHGLNASKTAPGDEIPQSFRVVDDAGEEVAGHDLPMQVAAREGREVRGLEFNVQQSDGRMVRLLEYAAPIFDEQAVPRGSIGAFIDITQRRADEERQRFLVALDDEIRPLTDPAQIVAVAARLLGQHMKVNRCAYADIEDDEDTMNITGNYCRDVPSIVGRYTFTQFGSEVLRLMRADQAFVVEDIKTHLPPPENQRAYELTMIRSVICVPLRKEGRFVAAMAVHQTTPRKWQEGEVELVLRVASRCWESIERAKVTRALLDSDERFRLLADNISQLAWMADAEGGIFWYNRRWFEYTGTTLEEMKGWGWHTVHHPEYLERVTVKWEQHLSAGREWEDTFPLKGKDGSYRWFLSRAFPSRDDQGAVLRWFGTNTDITAQRESSEALAAAVREAQSASKAKDDFLAVLSHELRTPLTPVLLSAASLEGEPGLPEAVRSQISMMRRNIELEARLIDDLLDVTRISRGKLALRMEPANAHQLLALAKDILKDEAEAKKLTIKAELAATSVQLNCDPARMQQAFWNVLKNAIKFTPVGGSVTIRTVNASDGDLCVEMEDTGIGISSEVLGLIFQPFEQGGLVNDHRYGGLGLGLAISKAIVEMHHGTISAASPGPHQGATFTIKVPTVESRSASGDNGSKPKATPSTSTSKEVRPLRILLIDDHADTLVILARLLRRAKHDVVCAASVEEGKTAAAEGRFDVVVSDIGLPDGTGYELMQTLRAAYGLRGIALTGYGMSEDRRLSHDVGFVAHLTKPVSFDQLEAALRDFQDMQPP